MLSVVIHVAGDTPALLETLAALVPGVAEGLVRDVVLAAHAPTTFVRDVADASGCALMTGGASRRERIADAAGVLKADWAMALEAGLVPGADWMAEAADFMASGRAPQAGFTLVRRGAAFSAWRINMTATLLGRLHPLQGVIARRQSLAAGGAAPSIRLRAPVFDRRPDGC